MNVYVARLIDCGMPRVTAVWIVNHYRRNATLHDLERYIEDVEGECCERLDAV